LIATYTVKAIATGKDIASVDFGNNNVIVSEVICSRKSR
jgi:hypothetical protein